MPNADTLLDGRFHNAVYTCRDDGTVGAGALSRADERTGYIGGGIHLDGSRYRYRFA